MPRLARTLLPALLALTACQPTARALGESAAAARANADALFGALQARFGPRSQSAEAARSRERFARSALVPSRLFRDSALWSAVDDSARALVLAGAPAAGGYHIAVRANDPLPRWPGEYRRTVGLRTAGNGVFTWRVRDELAAGPATPADLSRALGALLAAAERTPGGEARAAAQVALPRTAAILARLIALDSLALAPAPGGGTELRLAATLDPRRLTPTAPALARYLRKYVTPAEVALIAYDTAGVEWWAAGVRAGRVTLRLRIRDGALAPLAAPPGTAAGRMPDAFRVRVDLSTKFGPFRVGVRGLVGEVTLQRTATAKAFTARFRREPDWRLPPLVEHLVRAPLRRPFEGEGAVLGIAAHDTAGTLLLERGYTVTVQESAIVRWLGGLGGGAVSDFRAGAEQEYDRYLGELLGALRADAAALLAPPP